jgi:hypothetical protein
VVTSPYLTTFGRDFAPSIEAFSGARYGNCLFSVGSSYSEAQVGACDVFSMFAFCRSSLDMNFMKSAAVALFFANSEIA